MDSQSFDFVFFTESGKFKFCVYGCKGFKFRFSLIRIILIRVRYTCLVSVLIVSSAVIINYRIISHPLFISHHLLSAPPIFSHHIMPTVYGRYAARMRPYTDRIRPVCDCIPTVYRPYIDRVRPVWKGIPIV